MQETSPLRPSGSEYGPSDALDPMGKLLAFHGQIARHCHSLAQRAVAVRTGAPAADAPASADALLRFFDQALPTVLAIEERLLFPALMESVAGSDPVCLREMTRAFSDDHRALDTAWQRCVRPTFLQLAAGHSPGVLELDEIDAFVAQYVRHMAQEDTELLQMARRLIDARELERIGAELAQHEGLLDT